MRISDLIAELGAIENEEGDIEVLLQNNPDTGDKIVGECTFFVVVEKYTEETVCNIRTWPY